VKITNKIQLYRLIYYSKSALHVSGDIFAHHQEHLTVFTVSGNVHPSCCRLVPADWIQPEHQDAGNFLPMNKASNPKRFLFA
jgi:hypothetical protein